MRKIVFALLAIVLLAAVVGCGSAQQPGKSTGSNDMKNKTPKSTKPSLSVLYAGSMTKVMEHKIRPQVKKKLGFPFKGEGKGSTALAHMIQSGISHPDVFISASPSANQILMGSQNHNLVKWYLSLARDQLVIAYSPKSRFKSQLDKAAKRKTPWYKVLESKGFQLGRTDPLLDPKGEKTIFMFELASKYYHKPDLKKQILGSNENPKQVFPEETLLARLTSGQVDATITYKHEAVEWNVPYISLPDQINLGNQKFAKYYAQATFKNKKGKVSKGKPIVFTITIPGTVSHKKEAGDFVKYMIKGSGHDDLMKDGFTSIPTKAWGAKAEVPKALQSLLQGETK